MNTQNSIGRSVALIVTPSFVEAEDIADALRRFDLSEVLHARDSATGLARMDASSTPPSLALIAFDREDSYFDTLLTRLHAAKARVVLINGHPELAQDFGTGFLMRPFSNSDLDRCIAEVIPGL
ncbi:MAG: hypothetical protein AAGF36_10580 [Pseudomonadota bacterium]